MVCRWRFLDLSAQGGGDRQGDGGCQPKVGKIRELALYGVHRVLSLLQNEVCQCCYITRDTLQIVVIARESKQSTELKGRLCCAVFSSCTLPGASD